jgi:hypothetical protein
MKAWHWWLLGGALVILVIGFVLLTGVGGDKGQPVFHLIDTSDSMSAKHRRKDVAREAMARDGRELPVIDAADQPGGANAPAPVERKIIYTATVKLEVDDLPKAEEALLQLIAEYKGQLEQSENTGARGTSRHGNWTIRIDPDRRADFQKAVGKLGEQEQVSLKSQEVTQEYIDLVGRIKNHETEVESYRALLKSATTGAEKDTFTQGLSRAQRELESVLGRKKYLDNLVGMATVHVYLRERGVYVPPETADFGTSIGRSWTGSLNALVQVGRFLVLAAVALVPWLPLLLAVALTAYLWRRRKRSLIPTALEAPAPRPEGPPAGG